VDNNVLLDCWFGYFGFSVEGKEMIKDRDNKLKEIVETISTRIKSINEKYGKDPSLYFYQRIIYLRKRSNSINSFLFENLNLEILYATLVSWGMNSRRAKMKYFDEFKKNLLSINTELSELEKCSLNFNPEEIQSTLACLNQTFPKLELMESNGKLVANSKCLHFMFPSLCMPIDGSNTLTYLYNSTYESVKRYIEVIQFSFEIMRVLDDCQKLLDNQWNQTIPKMIDNAIILLMNEKNLLNPIQKLVR
jgi:hypothetical protein